MKERYLEYTLNIENKSTWVIVVQNDIMDKLDMCIQEIGDFYIKDFSRTEREGLESYQIVLNIAGEGFLMYLGKEYRILPGQLIFLDCRKHYVLKDMPGSENLFVHFNSKKGAFYYEYFLTLNGNSPVISLQNPSKMEKAVKKLIALFQNQVTTQNYFCGIECMTSILTQVIDEAGTERSKGNSDARIQRVAAYIAANYTEHITLEELAKEACVSKYYLERIFFHSQGCTPMEYLNRIRITHAKEMLRFGELSITEIGNKIGLENTSYFIRLFRRYENMTPHKYRENWRFTK